MEGARKTGTREYWKLKEDEVLVECVQRFRIDNWEQVAEEIPGRTARQCRERYTNYLAPQPNIVPWTDEENRKLIGLVDRYGMKRSGSIQKEFPGRTLNNLVNQLFRLTTRAERLVPPAIPLTAPAALPQTPANPLTVPVALPQPQTADEEEDLFGTDANGDLLQQEGMGLLHDHLDSFQENTNYHLGSTFDEASFFNDSESM